MHCAWICGQFAMEAQVPPNRKKARTTTAGTMSDDIAKAPSHLRQRTRTLAQLAKVSLPVPIDSSCMKLIRAGTWQQSPPNQDRTWSDLEARLQFTIDCTPVPLALIGASAHVRSPCRRSGPPSRQRTLLISIVGFVTEHNDASLASTGPHLAPLVHDARDRALLFELLDLRDDLAAAQPKLLAEGLQLDNLHCRKCAERSCPRDCCGKTLCGPVIRKQCLKCYVSCL